ncbi:MAG: hypothetical protein ACRBDL_02135 [Alphaproteobacteria bacterium]
MTSDKSVSLAPTPPVTSAVVSSDELNPDYSYVDVASGSAVITQDTSALQGIGAAGGGGTIPVSVRAPSVSLDHDVTPPEGCRVQDRFDRKALVAYEWDRSRLSLDVDGIGMDGADVDMVRLEYKIRFQPEKTKKQRCRYPSRWQGLVGSGYSELIVREEDTVFEEIKALRKKANPYLERFF